MPISSQEYGDSIMAHERPPQAPSEDIGGRRSSLTVRALMTPNVVTLEQHQPIQEAINLFAGREFRHIPVVDGDRLVGVLSDRDALRAFARSQDHSTPIRAIMRADPHRVQTHTPVVEAIRLLLEHRINCLPVVGAQETLVGILTTTDLLQALLQLHESAGSRPA